jgi:hypothetical protein
MNIRAAPFIQNEYRVCGPPNIGAVGGFYAGECVILKQQFAYQTGLMTAMAEDVHPGVRHGR